MRALMQDYDVALAITINSSCSPGLATKLIGRLNVTHDEAD